MSFQTSKVTYGGIDGAYILLLEPEGWGLMGYAL
jgi:hypothetical protein